MMIARIIRTNDNNSKSLIIHSRVEIQLEMTEKHMKEDGILTEHFTCHTIRHAFSTRAIENGMKPQVLKTILGHSNISMTMDLYAHVLGEKKRRKCFYWKIVCGESCNVIAEVLLYLYKRSATEYTVSPRK